MHVAKLTSRAINKIESRIDARGIDATKIIGLYAYR